MESKPPNPPAQIPQEPQPIQPPIQPTVPLVAGSTIPAEEPENNHKFLIFGIVAGFIALALITFFLWNILKSNSQTANVIPEATNIPAQTPQATLQPEQSPSPTPNYPPLSDKVESWKTYEHPKLIIQYPSDWALSNMVDSESFWIEKDATTLHVYINQMMDDHCSELVKTEKITIDQGDANMVTYRKTLCQGESGSWIYAEANKNSDHFAFIMNLKTEDEEAGESLFKQIVSTAKFK